MVALARIWDNRARLYSPLASFLALLAGHFGLSAPGGGLGVGLCVLHYMDQSDRVSCNSLRTINDEMWQQLDALQDLYPELLDTLAMDFAKQVSLTRSERITIYNYNGNEDVFTPMGRWSQHPEFRKVNRPSYPAEQGIIARAFREGHCYACLTCDPSDDPDGYCDELLRNWSIPHEVTKRMRMKSRSLAGWAIRDTRDLDSIGVVVFESTHPELSQYDAITDAMGGTNGMSVRLSRLQHLFRQWEPTLGIARREGL